MISHSQYHLGRFTSSSRFISVSGFLVGISVMKKTHLIAIVLICYLLRPFAAMEPRKFSDHVNRARNFEWVPNIDERFEIRIITNFTSVCEAARICKAMKSNLASIHSEEENKYMYHLLLASVMPQFEFGTIRHILVALEENPLTHKLEWSDGTRVNFTSWKKGYKRKECVWMRMAIEEYHRPPDGVHNPRFDWEGGGQCDHFDSYNYAICERRMHEREGW